MINKLYIITICKGVFDFFDYKNFVRTEIRSNLTDKYNVKASYVKENNVVVCTHIAD